MTKDELIAALKEHMSVMEDWARDVPDERIDGDDSRAKYVADLERARELRLTWPAF